MNDGLKRLNIIENINLANYKSEIPFINFKNEDNLKGIIPFFKYENALTAIIIPGGGFDFCNFLGEGIFIAKEFNKHMMNAIVLVYGVKEKAQYPYPIKDLVKAINFLNEYYSILNINPNNYFLVGFSAGAHLAISYARDDIGYKKYGIENNAKALILSYPLVSLKNEITHIGSKNNILNVYKNNKSKEALYSHEFHISKNFPPTFIRSFKNDSLVNIKNSLLLKEKLDLFNVKNEFITYEGDLHGVGLGKFTSAEGWVDKAIQFIKGLD